MKVLTNLVVTEIKEPGYERVLQIRDPDSGLNAIIAIHNTKLGPALGGTRLYAYKTFNEALTDALRLSKGMTYKSAVAKTGTGGGKSVIFADPLYPKSDEVLHAFGKAVNYLEGQYICAEDVGITLADLAKIRESTKYVVGLPHKHSSGDPCRFTAWGVLRGINALCQHTWGSPSVKGKTVAIQGLGGVGMKLASYLFWEGAHLIVTDVNTERTQRAAHDFGARVVAPGEILSEECDILAPCAMGGIINPETIPTLRCRVIGGAANNQLLTDEDGDMLRARGILYAPDYVINAGGLLNVCAEIQPEGYCALRARSQVDGLYEVLLEIFAQAENKGQSTNRTANEIAEKRVAEGKSDLTRPIVFHH